MTDREVAEAAAGSAARAALARFRDAAGLEVAYKTSGADPVSEADRAAERAAVAVLRAERPGDGVLGEEGAAVAGGGRTWVVDALDGTANFLAGVPQWCSAVALREGDATLACAVVDAVRGETFSAPPGRGLAVRTGRPLDRALVATFLRPDKLDPPRAGAAAARLIGATGGLRTTGCGTLELAWVAAGRLDAWAQPGPDPWDWHPGALLVEAAGGATAVAGEDPPWHLAGAPDLVTALAGLLTA